MNGPSWSPTIFTIHADKITGYLLNRTHPDGASKARLLELFGFSGSAPEILAQALLSHARPGHFVREALTPLGDRKLVYEGPLQAPNGRAPRPRTVWRVLTDGTALFVTAVPLKEPG